MQGDMTALEQTINSRASRIQKITTKLGLNVWLVEDYTVPMIAFECACKGGAAQDPADKAGLATMMAGLLDEGAGELDSTAFHRAMDDKAIEISFSVSRDHLRGHLKTLSKYARDAFDLLKLALIRPRFDDEAIERIRAQMIASLKREARDPDVLAGKLWREMATPHHPYGLSLRGDVDTLPLITRDDIINAHKNLIARDHLCVAVVGAIDAKTLAAYLDDVFADVPAHAHLKRIDDVILPVHGARRIAAINPALWHAGYCAQRS
jgi:zinc protease